MTRTLLVLLVVSMSCQVALAQRPPNNADKVPVAIKWISNEAQVEVALTTYTDTPILLLMSESKDLLKELEAKKPTLKDETVLRCSKYFKCVLLQRVTSNEKFYDRMVKEGLGKLAGNFCILEGRKLPKPPVEEAKIPSIIKKKTARSAVFKKKATSMGSRLGTYMQAHLKKRFGVKVNKLGIASQRQSENKFVYELQIEFENAFKITPALTLKMWLASKKTKKEVRTFKYFGTYKDVPGRQKHRLAVSYPQEFHDKHGRLVAGRVEIYLGGEKSGVLLTSSDTGKPPKPKWWHDAPWDKLILYSNQKYNSNSFK